jgi:hypothetical protein
MRSNRINDGAETNFSREGMAHFFRARFKTFDIPIVRDAVVIGQEAPATLENLLQTLRLICPEALVGLPIADEIVGALIIREALLKKIPQNLIERFVLQRVKPYMSASEILRLDLELETVIEANV